MQFASTIKNRTTCPDLSGSRHTIKVFNRACKTCPDTSGANPKEKLFLIPIAIETNASKNKKCNTLSRLEIG